MNGVARDGLYRRGSVWWMSYVASGRRIRESTGFWDRKAAELVLAKIKVALKEGKWFSKSRVVRTPLFKAIEEFLTLYAKPRKVSWRDDQTILRRFAEYVGPCAVLQEIDRITIERFLRTILARGASPTRSNRYVASLKSFWNRHIEWGHATANPVKGIKLYAERMETSYLEVGQVRALIDACSPRLRPVVQVALLTGLRQGDILNLRWEAIDFDRQQVSVVQGKTKTPLTLHLSHALARVLAAVSRDADCPYVFHFRRRALKRYGWVRSDYLAAIRAAGIPQAKRRFHTLRHTVATQLRFLGKDLAVIKEQLGHKTLRMTLRYAHVAPEELKQAADQLGEKLLGEGQAAPSLVTFRSQSALQSSGENRVGDQNSAVSEAESDSRRESTETTHRTVNAPGARREGSVDGALRRADESSAEQQ